MNTSLARRRTWPWHALLIAAALSLALPAASFGYVLTVNGGAGTTTSAAVTLQASGELCNPGDGPSTAFSVRNAGFDWVATGAQSLDAFAWELAAGDGAKQVDATLTCQHFVPRSCSQACGSTCCGGYYWGSCTGWCTVYCPYDCSYMEYYSSTASATIDLDAIAPEAGPDWYGAAEDTPLVVPAPGLLGNDGDTEGRTLTAVKVGDPYYGALTLNADGSFTYTPAPGFAGSDSFQYLADDGILQSAPASVSIFVEAVNDPPVLDAVGDKGVLDGQPLTFKLTASDPDASDTLFFSASGLLGDAWLDPTTGDFSWTPGAAHVGDHVVTFTVTDAGGLSDSEQITITVASSVRQVEVAGIGDGFGSVTSNVEGLAFLYQEESGVTRDLPLGQQLLLTATGNDGTTASWDNCEAVGGTSAGNGTGVAECALGLDADKALTVTFTVTGATLRLQSVAAYDGTVLETAELSGTGGLVDAAGKTLRVGDDAAKKQYRSVLSFDTAQVPDTAVVTSATLRIKRQGTVGANPFATHGKLLVDVRSGAFSNKPALQAADFAAPATKAAAAAVGKLAVAGWHSKALAPETVNLAGPTQLRLRFAKDDDDDLTADYLSFYSGNAGSAARPVLEIVYYVP